MKATEHQEALDEVMRDIVLIYEAPKSIPLPASCTGLAGNTRQSIFNQLHYRWAEQARSDFQRA